MNTLRLCPECGAPLSIIHDHVCRITADAAIKDQPSPKGTDIDITALVQQDIEARAQKGEQTYGERLKPNNGRDALVDAYQEALDLCMYLRQCIEENKGESK